MPYVYVEARPKGRPQGSAVEDFAVEDHAAICSRLSRNKRRRSIGGERTTMPASSPACGT
jgi:hypothetical protein